MRQDYPFTTGWPVLPLAPPLTTDSAASSGTARPAASAGIPNTGAPPQDPARPGPPVFQHRSSDHICSMARMAHWTPRRTASAPSARTSPRGNLAPKARYRSPPHHSSSSSAASSRTHTPNRPSPMARSPPTARNNCGCPRESAPSAPCKPSSPAPEPSAKTTESPATPPACETSNPARRYRAARCKMDSASE